MSNKFINIQDIDLNNLDELDEYDFEDRETFSNQKYSDELEYKTPKNSKKNKPKRK